MEHLITGIQQCGIGTKDAYEAALFYKNLLGMKCLVFDDIADASLMKRYTGNEVQRRRAMLTMNLQGGGGLELWQFLNREPQPNLTATRFGDLGIYAIKIKTANVAAAHQFFSARKDCSVSPILSNTIGEDYFWLNDRFGAVFNIVKARELFNSKGAICGGVCGAVIGVSNLKTSLRFYKEFLNISQELFAIQKTMTAPFENTDRKINSALLLKPMETTGAFSELLGSIEIELIETTDMPGKKIFENRYWGDLGFIHLCFDVVNMDALKNRAINFGYAFTVDSANSFIMEDAGGRFCYTEDPDGTLIELVETHKVPILKKMGWFLDLQKRSNNKPLPAWMIRTMGFNKVQ